MRRLDDLIGRCRRHIPRDSRRARIFEPIAWMITFRGSTRSTLRFIHHHGITVGAGPFAGLRYPRSAVLHVPGLVPRLAGTYELEVRQIVEALARSQPELLINIGAADGYYAVGLALRCPMRNVIAYEADPYRVHVSSHVARLNNVGDRIDLRGVCTVEALARLSPPLGTVRDL